MRASIGTLIVEAPFGGWGTIAVLCLAYILK